MIIFHLEIFEEEVSWNLLIILIYVFNTDNYVS